MNPKTISFFNGSYMPIFFGILMPLKCKSYKPEAFHDETFSTMMCRMTHPPMKPMLSQWMRWLTEIFMRREKGQMIESIKNLAISSSIWMRCRSAFYHYSTAFDFEYDDAIERNSVIVPSSRSCRPIIISNIIPFHFLLSNTTVDQSAIVLKLVAVKVFVCFVAVIGTCLNYSYNMYNARACFNNLNRRLCSASARARLWSLLNRIGLTLLIFPKKSALARFCLKWIDRFSCGYFVASTNCV